MNIEKHLERVYEKMPNEVKDNLILLVVGGSHAYGTNVANSDIDLRGICLKTKSQLLGLEEFEQWVDIETDTTIYALDKFVKLAMNANPNVLELLGCKAEHYVVLTEQGKKLLDNVGLFISKRAIHSFGGYAGAQLRRLQNALVRDEYNDNDKEKHILSTIENMKYHLTEHYSDFDLEDFNLYIDESDKEDLETEIFMDVSLSRYPLRDFTNVQKEMNEVIKTYSKLGQRNKKKDSESLQKHAMHLVRLYLMLFDILEHGKVVTYRKDDIDFLMSIRLGIYSTEEVFRYVDHCEAKLEVLKKRTKIRDKVDYNAINDLLIGLNYG